MILGLRNQDLIRKSCLKTCQVYRTDRSGKTYSWDSCYPKKCRINGYIQWRIYPFYGGSGVYIHSMVAVAYISILWWPYIDIESTIKVAIVKSQAEILAVKKFSINTLQGWKERY